MLGTLAGISIAFISMRPAAQMFEALWIALPVMVIILIGFFTDLKLPGNIPVGLAALLVGTALAWVGGYMSVPDVIAAGRDVAVVAADARPRRGWGRGWPTSPRCSRPRSRWASTTSPRG